MSVYAQPAASPEKTFGMSNLGWLVTRIVAPAAVILTLGILYNVFYAARLEETWGFAVLLVSWFFVQGFFLVAGVGIAWWIGKIALREVPLLQICSLWLLTSLAHVISGSFAIYSLLTVPWDVKLSDIPMVLSVFPNGGENFLGAVINQLAIDEFIHLGLFTYFAGQRLKVSFWVLFPLFLLPYLVAVAVNEIRYFR